jgi:hypothetical protein
MSAKTFIRKLVDNQAVEIRRLHDQARTVTDAAEKTEILKRLLNLDAPPPVRAELHAALQTLNELPALSEHRPREVVTWCNFLLSLPAERARQLAKSLRPVFGRLDGKAAEAFSQVLRWIMFEEPQP